MAKKTEKIPAEINDELLRLRREVKELSSTLELERRQYEIRIEQAEAAAKESQERLAFILQGADMGTWEWNVQTGRVRDDEHWLNMLGYEVGEIKSDTLHWGPYIHPEDTPRMGRTFAAHSKGIIPFYEDEYRVRAKSGSWIYVLDKGKVVERDPSGEPVLVAGVHIDITRRRQAEEALRTSEERFKRLVQYSNDIIAIVDETSILTDISGPIERIVGFKPEELIGSVGVDRIHPDDREGAIIALGEVMKQPNGLARYEYRYRHSNGNWVHLEAVGSNLLQDPGVKGVVMNIRDISKRKRAEAIANESRERLKLALEAAGMSSWDLNNQTGEVIDREGWLENLGYQPGEFEPTLQNFNALIHPDDLQEVERAASNHLNGKTEHYSAEYRIRNKSGSWVWVLDRGKLVSRDSSGKPHRTMGVHLDITEHKHTMEQVRQLANEQRTILNTISMGICHLKNRKIQWVNPAFAEIFGYAAEELTGQDTLILYSNSEDYLRVQEDGYPQLAKGLPYTIETPMRKKNASLIWCSLTGQALSGNLEEGSIWALSDITDRREIEEALRYRERQFRALVETTSDLVWEVNADGIYTYVSPKIKDLLGYEPEAVIGKSPFDLMPVEEAYRVSLLLKVFKSSRLPFSGLQNINLHKDGREVVLETNGVPIWDAQGNFSGYRGIDRDITERKNAEEERRKAMDWQKAIFEGSRDAIMISDANSMIMDVNEAAVRMTGYSKDELLTMRGPDLNRDTNLVRFEEIQRRVLSGEDILDETVIYTKDGRRLDMEFGHHRVLIDGKQYLHSIARDVTERKQLEAQLRHVQKMEAIGTLAGGIAHDFNNILSVVIGFSQLIQGDAPDDENVKAEVGGILKACTRAKDLVKQILTFSRQTEGEKQPLRLPTIITEVLTLLRASIPANIEIKHRLASSCGPVLADATQIHQVLLNLTTNAYHALRETGGQIEISLEERNLSSREASAHPPLKPGMHAVIGVSDNGSGMSEATLQRIYEPYFTTKKPGEGTGLGLAIVHSIIGQHAGAISVSSELGKGTRFDLFFPICINAESESPDTDTAMIPSGTERVLFVDDEKAIVEINQTGLQRFGYKVTAFSDALEAANYFQLHPDDFDVIVTDLTMPKMTGTDLAHLIYELRPTIPLVLCSGFAKSAREVRGTLEGITEFVEKPVQPDGIGWAIRRVMKKRRG